MCDPDFHLTLTTGHISSAVALAATTMVSFMDGLSSSLLPLMESSLSRQLGEVSLAFHPYGPVPSDLNPMNGGIFWAALLHADGSRSYIGLDHDLIRLVCAALASNETTPDGLWPCLPLSPCEDAMGAFLILLGLDGFQSWNHPDAPVRLLATTAESPGMTTLPPVQDHLDIPLLFTLCGKTGSFRWRSASQLSAKIRGHLCRKIPGLPSPGEDPRRLSWVAHSPWLPILANSTIVLQVIVAQPHVPATLLLELERGDLLQLNVPPVVNSSGVSHPVVITPLVRLKSPTDGVANRMEHEWSLRANLIWHGTGPWLVSCFPNEKPNKCQIDGNEEALAPNLADPSPTTRSPAIVPPPSGARLVEGVSIRLQVILGTFSLAVNDLLQLAPGMIFSLDCVPGDPVEIQCEDGTRVGDGHLLSMDGHLSIRMINLEERLTHACRPRTTRPGEETQSKEE